MCDLDRAGTKGVTSLAVKDSRQRDGDGPVQKSWLRSLVGVLGYMAADRPDLQYLVMNLMREVTHATCGTVARARRVVRYLVRKPRLAWSFAVGAQLAYLDAFADSDWAAKPTEHQLLCHVQTRKACARN